MMEQLAVAERESKTLQVRVSEGDAQFSESQRRLRATEEALQEKQKEVVSLKSELQLMGKDKKDMIDGFRVQMTGELSDKINAAERALEEKKKALDELSHKYEALEVELAQVKEEAKTQEESSKNMSTTIIALQSQNLAMLEKRVESNEGKGKEGDESVNKKLELAARKYSVIIFFFRRGQGDLIFTILSFICREDSRHPRRKITAAEGPEKGEDGD